MSSLKNYIKSGTIVLMLSFVSNAAFAEMYQKVEYVSTFSYTIAGNEGTIIVNDSIVVPDSTSVNQFNRGDYTILVNTSGGKNVAQLFNRDYVEMADMMFVNGKIYVVVGVLLIVLCGMFVYLITLNRKISKLEKELN